MSTISVDFDGVVHAYSLGWHDGTIYDGPVPGALEALKLLMRNYAVVIHTTRDPIPVIQWLEPLGFPCSMDTGREFWQEQGRLLVTSRKLPCVAYIDDRAVRFTSWPQALDDLIELTGRTAELS